MCSQLLWRRMSHREWRRDSICFPAAQDWCPEVNRDEISFDRPLRLGQLVAGVVRRRGVAERSATEELNSIWSQMVGERIAGKSSVRRLRAGVLEIGVCNGAVLEELNSYLRHDLLRELRLRLPRHGIRSVKFVRMR